MPLYNDLQALRDVLAADAKFLRAQAALAALDKGTKAAAAYNTTKAEADQLRAAANKAVTEQKDAEMRLASFEAKSVEVQKTLYAGKVTTPKELENLQKELEMLGRQKGDGETKVLEAMESAGAQVAQAEAAEARLAALADAYRAIRAAYKKRHAELSQEIAGYEKDRAAAVKVVPAALLARYEGLRAKKNGIGAAVVEADGACGACHMKLNTQLTDDTKAAETPQVCEYCGRLLIPAPPA